MTDVSSIAKDDRHDFRILARALYGECKLMDDEWNQWLRNDGETIPIQTLREIVLSAGLDSVKDADLKGTLLHEMIHAAGFPHGEAFAAETRRFKALGAPVQDKDCGGGHVPQAGTCNAAARIFHQTRVVDEPAGSTTRASRHKNARGGPTSTSGACGGG